MTKYIAILTMCIALLTGCSVTIVVDEQFTATPSGKLSISEDWGVDPGKFGVEKWDGEVHVFYFEIYNNGEDACFQIDGDEHSSLCIMRGGSDIVAWPASEDTQFTIKKLGQGNIQHEILCKIEQDEG